MNPYKKEHQPCFICKKLGHEVFIDTLYDDSCQINERGNKIPKFLIEGTDNIHKHADELEREAQAEVRNNQQNTIEQASAAAQKKQTSLVTDAREMLAELLKGNQQQKALAVLQEERLRLLLDFYGVKYI